MNTQNDEYKLTKGAFQKLKYTPDQINELRKCYDPNTGPTYFMENFMYVQHATRGIIQFKAYDFQYDLIDNYHKNRMSISLVSRQMGKTTCAAGYLLWYAMFNPNSTILIAAHKYTGAQEIMERVRFVYENCPDHIRAGVSVYNKNSLKFDNGSRIIAQTTTPSTGRGMSLSLVYLDEFSFVQNNIAQEFFTSISPALSTGGKCMITSTPNNPDDKFADIWKKAANHVDEYGEPKAYGKNDFVPFSVDWRAHPDRDDEWAESERVKIGTERFMREHENKFVIFEETLIDSLTLDELKPSDPISSNSHVRWYKKISPHMTYVVSLDPSMGTGGDYAAIQVLELPSLEQVAEWQHNKSSIENQIRILRDITHYISNAGASEIYWSVENNGMGEAALVVIREMGEDTFMGSMLHDPNRKGTGIKRKGFTTTSTTKMEACSRMKSLIETGKLKIHSKNLLSELRVFVRSTNTYAAKLGEHDDLVMAMLLAVRMIAFISSWDESTASSLNSKTSADSEYDDDYDSPLPILF